MVSAPFGRQRVRGIVVSVDEQAPAGIDPVSIEAVVGDVPPALVDLALWLADYYGSTPARALALVGPQTPKRRKVQPPPAERQALVAEAAPVSLSVEHTAAVA